jgi:hypothetical protein
MIEVPTTPLRPWYRWAKPKRMFRESEIFTLTELSKLERILFPNALKFEEAPSLIH